MRKIAFFVEGRTEMRFVVKLLTEIASKNQVLIDTQEIRGGGKLSGKPRTYATVGIKQEPSNEQFYALIYDCGSDAQVKICIEEEHKNLSDNGYEVIVAIRDVRPDFTKQNLKQLRKLMGTGVDRSLIPIVFILSVAEIEAWFLSEHTHFSRINPNLTMASIKAALGFDPSVDDMSDRETPADDLNACYKLVNLAYRKDNAHRTVSALDMNDVYVALVNKIPELDTLVRAVDKFLTPKGQAVSAGTVQAAGTV